MTLVPMSLVWAVDIIGASLMIVLSLYAVKLMREIYIKKRDISLYSYLYAQTIALAIFALSRSVGHILKRILITAGYPEMWETLSPVSGSINSLIFVVFGLAALLYSNVKATSDRVDALERGKRELKKSEAKFKTLFENATDAIFLADERGRYIDVNEKALEVSGYSKEELLGKTIKDLVHPGTPVEIFPKILKEGAASGEFELLRKDGTLVPVELRGTLMEINGRKIVQGIVRDISERKKAEEEIENRMEDLKIINNIIRDVSSTIDLEEVLHRITKSAAELINGDAASIAVFDEEKGVVTYPYHYNMPEKIKKVVARKGQGLAGQIIETKTSVLIEEYPSHPRALKEFVDAGLKVLIAVPLISKDKVSGALGVFGLTKEKRFSKHDLEILEAVGKETAVAIENARLYQKIKGFSETLEKKVKERTSELEDAQKALVTLLEDVNQAKDELEKANAQLQELDRLKSMFIASMSHELRTPLNSIIGFSGILLMGMAGELNEEQRKQLKMVKSSAQHLLNLINDIIDLSKIEAGKVDITIEKFDLSRVVKEVMEPFAVAAEEKDLDIHLKTPERLIIESDQRRVKQILMNLVGNAVKFTDEGGIDIEVVEKKGRVEVSVSDTGIGIREDDMGKLFKPFSQITAPDRPKEGTGLGLYLSKSIARHLTGGIWAESEFGKGSVFTLSLPLRYQGMKK